MDSRHRAIFRTMLFCSSWIHDITQYSEQRWSVLHCFTTSSDHQNNSYAPLLDDITRSSEQRCVIFRGFTISHCCLNNVVLFFATSPHGTIIISIFCALWLQYISSLLEQRWFVLYCLTTSHNRQNNVGLSFIVSRHHTTVRTTSVSSARIHYKLSEYNRDCHFSTTEAVKDVNFIVFRDRRLVTAASTTLHNC